MPLPITDISNPDVIKFLIENYEKTAKLRIKWNKIHGHRVQKAATLGREEKGYIETDVLKTAMANGLPTITREHLNAGRHRRSKPIRDGVFIPGVACFMRDHSLVKVGLGDVKEDWRLGRTDHPDPKMRPIDPEHIKMIYKDHREEYLKCRSKIIPEKRYYHDDTAGSVYGWRLRDSYFCKQVPSYGRVCKLSLDVSKTGPQPDPEHYKTIDKTGATKCLAE